MSRKCLFWAITAAAVIWTEILAFLLDNAALMILGLFAGLVWAWAGGVGQYLIEPDRKRPPR
jgi:uncharacterized RDD family membrane protein YckC